MQILAVLSSANRDPKVFGGETKSAAVAKMFNPSRDQSQLDQMLTPKGTMIGQQKGACYWQQAATDAVHCQA